MDKNHAIKILINEYVATVVKELIESEYQEIINNILKDLDRIQINDSQARQLVQKHNLEGGRGLLLRGYTVEDKQRIKDLVSSLERSDNVMNRCFAASYLHISSEGFKSTVNQLYQHYQNKLALVLGRIVACVKSIKQGFLDIIPDEVLKELFDSYSFTGDQNIRWVIKSLEKLSHSRIRAFIEKHLSINQLGYEPEDIDNILTDFKPIKFTKTIDQNWWTDDIVLNHLEGITPYLPRILPLTTDAITIHQEGDRLLDNIIQQAVTDANQFIGNQVMVAVNLYNAHWAGLVIRNTPDGLNIIYNDPLGTPMPEFLRNILIDAAAQIDIHVQPCNIRDLRIQLQNDSNNCGPLTVHTLRTLAQKNIDINSEEHYIRQVLTEGYDGDLGQILRLEMESECTQTDPLDLITDVEIFVHHEHFERLNILQQEEAEMLGIYRSFFDGLN